MERVMTASLALILYIVHSATADSTSAAQNATEAIQATTPMPGFSLNITHLASSTSSITIGWDIPMVYFRHVDMYYIQSRKLDSQAIIYSPQLNTSVSLYKITDLMTHSRYEICLFAKFKEYHELAADGEQKSCEEIGTIPLIRWENLLAAFLAVGYILLMVFIGYLCWWCAKRKLATRAAAHEQKEEREELLEKTNAPGGVLLAVPRQERPRSSIEEELPYIPYITPPIEELDNENEWENKYSYGGANNI